MQHKLSSVKALRIFLARASVISFLFGLVEFRSLIFRGEEVELHVSVGELLLLLIGNYISLCWLVFSTAAKYNMAIADPNNPWHLVLNLTLAAFIPVFGIDLFTILIPWALIDAVDLVLMWRRKNWLKSHWTRR